MSNDFRSALQSIEALRKLGDLTSGLGSALAVPDHLSSLMAAIRDPPTPLALGGDRDGPLLAMQRGDELQRTLHQIEQTNRLLQGPASQALSTLTRQGPPESAAAALSAAVRALGPRHLLPLAWDIHGLALAAAQPGGPAFDILGELGRLDAVETAMASMTRPWLGAGEELRSAKAVADLVAIGHGAAGLPPFGDTLARALRSGLGDWREAIGMATSTWEDTATRIGMYRDRGFDSALTGFDRGIFSELVQGTGLVLPSPQEEPEGEDAGLERSRAAFVRLQRLERKLRRFIAEALQKAHGNKWPQRRLPARMLDTWASKQAKAAGSGQPSLELIEYADFADYKTIIERGDNWSEIFQQVFRRPEDIRESLQRLFPLRIAVMHARPITQDDELLLVVETTRIERAIERRPGGRAT